MAGMAWSSVVPGMLVMWLSDMSNMCRHLSWVPAEFYASWALAGQVAVQAMVLHQMHCWVL